MSLAYREYRTVTWRGYFANIERIICLKGIISSNPLSCASNHYTLHYHMDSTPLINHSVFHDERARGPHAE